MKQKLVKPISKFSPKILVLLVVPLVAFGVYTLLSSKAATPVVASTANLWVDLSANPNSCTRQSTPGNYSDGGACGSLSDAFLAASCGDRIYVRGTTGTYPQQKLSSGHTGTCTEIMIASTPGETVTIDDLVLDGASNIRIKGAGSKKATGYGVMNVGNTNPDVGSPDIRGGTNVVFDGINYVSSGQVVGGTNITVENSDIGPFTPATCPGAGMPIANNSSTPVTGFTFRDNYVHDYRFTNCTPPNDHLDCIHMYEFLRGPTVIEGNKIENCQNYGILMEGTSNAKIRNNWFGSVVTNCGFAFHGGAAADNFSDITIEFNSATSCITPQTTNNLTNVVMRGNVASNVGGVCRQGITYSYNKQIDGGNLAAVCGTGDSVSVNPGFINTNTGNLDLHVQTGSILKDSGGPACPTLDYDAETRPAGTMCDVGADEIGAGTTTDTANVWIDSDGGNCTYSAQSIGYSSATACSTISDALNTIGSGKGPTSVKVITGSYPGQTVPDDSRAAADRVIFSEANGDVEFDYLDIHGDNITLDGFKTIRPYRTVDYQEGVSIVGSSTQSKGVHLVNVIAQGGVYLSETNGVRINGGEICCTMATASHDQKVFTTNGIGALGGQVTDTIIDGTQIHDAHKDAPSTHSECGFLISPQTLKITNSRFYRCNGYNLSIARIGTSPDPSNITIENNTFEPTDSVTPGAGEGFYSIVLDHVTTRYNNLIFRNNSFGSGIEWGVADVPSTAYSQTSFVSNILHAGSCAPSSGPAGSPTYSYNVTDIPGGCGTNSKVVANSLNLYTAHSTAGSWDFRLLPVVGAIDAGSPTNSTASDILGTSRSQGAAPDAGAYEFLSGTPPTTKPGDVNGDGSVNITDISALLSAYGQTGSSLAADLDKNGSVNIADLSIILTNYGK